jgi:hypothetical protein
VPLTFGVPESAPLVDIVRPFGKFAAEKLSGDTPPVALACVPVGIKLPCTAPVTVAQLGVVIDGGGLITIGQRWVTACPFSVTVNVTGYPVALAVVGVPDRKPLLKVSPGTLPSVVIVGVPPMDPPTVGPALYGCPTCPFGGQFTVTDGVTVTEQTGLVAGLFLPSVTCTWNVTVPAVSGVKLTAGPLICPLGKTLRSELDAIEYENCGYPPFSITAELYCWPVVIVVSGGHCTDGAGAATSKLQVDVPANTSVSAESCGLEESVRTTE